MFPDRKKKLIIWGVAIIALIFVIIIMYNLSNYMRNLQAEQEEEYYDDTYPTDYVYYGFAVDEDGNYQLWGLDSDYNEVQLGLRSFYNMSNMYYYNNHLMLYVDGINQINYNATEESFYFYELDDFYSNTTDILISDDYYIFYDGETLEYCLISDCTRTSIATGLDNDLILLGDNCVFYQSSTGFYIFDFETLSSSLVMSLYPLGEKRLLATDGDYLIYINGDTIYSYRVANGTNTNINDALSDDETEFSFVNIINNYFLYQVVDEDGNYQLKKYSLRVNNILNNDFILGSEAIASTFVVNDTLLYAELVDEEDSRNVLIDINENRVVKVLENNYVVLIGV